jgi:hypothetical protein
MVFEQTKEKEGKMDGVCSNFEQQHMTIACYAFI